MHPSLARTSLASLRIGMGVMWLAPRFGARMLGVDPEAQSAVAMMSRLFAVRELVLGAMLLNADGSGDRDRVVEMGILVDAADVVAIVLAASRKEVGARTLLLGGGAAAAALAFGVIARDA